jgi:hypothetical protein
MGNKDHFRDIVLQTGNKQHTISAKDLRKHPESLLSKLASGTAGSSTCGNRSSSSTANVLHLDTMTTTPLSEWPESAAPVICELYRCACSTAMVL